MSKIYRDLFDNKRLARIALGDVVALRDEVNSVGVQIKDYFAGTSGQADSGTKTASAPAYYPGRYHKLGSR